MVSGRDKRDTHTRPTERSRPPFISGSGVQRRRRTRPYFSPWPVGTDTLTRTWASHRQTSRRPAAGRGQRGDARAPRGRRRSVRFRTRPAEARFAPRFCRASGERNVQRRPYQTMAGMGQDQQNNPSGGRSAVPLALFVTRAV